MQLQALAAALIHWLTFQQPVAGNKLHQQHVTLHAADAIEDELIQSDKAVVAEIVDDMDMDDLLAQWKEQQVELERTATSQETMEVKEDFAGAESVLPNTWAVIGPFAAAEMGVDPLRAFGGINNIVARAPQGFWETLRVRSKIFQEAQSMHMSIHQALGLIRSRLNNSQVFAFPANATDGIAEFPTERGPAGRSIWGVSYTAKRRWTYVNFKLFANQSGVATDTFDPRTGSGSGWAVGEIHLQNATAVLAQCSMAFYVGSSSTSYFADIYKEHRAIHVLHLPAGRTRLFVNTREPGFRCLMLKDSAAARQAVTGLPDETEGRSPFITLSDYTISSVVESKMVSPHLGIPVINAHHESLHLQRAEIRDGPANLRLEVDADGPEIQPSQAMILRLKLSHEGDINCTADHTAKQKVLNFTVALFPGCVGCSPSITRVVSHCKERASQGYVVAFPDFDGSIQKFWAAPPNLTRFGRRKCPPAGCPVLLSLHGASVSIGPVWGLTYNYNGDLANASDGFPFPAWLVQPTNRWHWGTDWEGPGFDNAISALNFAKEALPGAPGTDSLEDKQKRIGLDATRIVVTGHSMGGHGCFVFATHFPDLLLGAACASGWASMNSYSQTTTHSRLLDGSRRGLLEAPRYEHAADFSASNLEGLPMLIIYGSKDDNVPPAEPRSMNRLVDSASANSSALQNVELPNFPHWFGQNSEPMPQFFEDRLKPSESDESVQMPGLPQVFEFTVTNPTTYGSRGSLQLLQQLDGAKPARFFVRRCNEAAADCDAAMNALREHGGKLDSNPTERDAVWQVDTFNVRRFALRAAAPGRPWPRALLVDGTMFTEDEMSISEHSHFCRAHPKEGSWKACGAARDGRSWEHLQKGPIASGPVHMALRRAPICIAHGSGTGQAEEALLLANKMYFVSRYTAMIFNAGDEHLPEDTAWQLPSRCSKAHLLLFGLPSENMWVKNLKCSFPYLHFSDRGHGFSVDGHAYSAEKSGLLALGSLPGGRLALLIHGTDAEGLARAAAAVPVTSGRHGADYMVFGPDSGWKGEGGILAAGYLDSLWQVSSSSWSEPEHATFPLTHLVKDSVPPGLDPACAGQRTLLDASDEEISEGTWSTTKGGSIHSACTWHLLCGVLLFKALI